MALIAVEEWIDINPWHGLRFGNLEPVEEGSIARYPVAGSLYDVTLGPRGLDVKRDGRRFFAADAPVEIRKVEIGAGRVRCEVRASRLVKLWIGSGPARSIAPGLASLEDSMA